MFLFLLEFVFAGANADKETFLVQRYVSGNWTTGSYEDFHAFYFIPIQNINHYQALLNDKFLDIYIKSSSSVDVTYENYNFSLEFQNTDSVTPYAFGQIESNLFIDVFICSRDTVDISIINKTNNEIKVWVLKKQISMTKKDSFLITCAFSSFYLIVLFFFYICCRKPQPDPKKKK